jgi:hypothetical protein
MVPTIAVPLPPLRSLVVRVAFAFGMTLGGFVVTALFYWVPLEHCHVWNSKMAVHTVQEALVHYRSDNDERCPSSLQRLVDGKYLTKAPRDEWGHGLRFVCPGPTPYELPVVTSAGPDGRFGTADDID